MQSMHSSKQSANHQYSSVVAEYHIETNSAIASTHMRSLEFHPSTKTPAEHYPACAPVMAFIFQQNIPIPTTAHPKRE
ncbi:hypothetical protein EYC84_000979 [Monilinia fructicola]|uniref:Uncharacterized protein n=1 Tax=Monilinia fructicola TaxID=38448 RepID=A0A5M9JNJ0_MONFR|nr:hypothetical protein EYC84_000979 [Monilinia fructicola]